jgi:hypothetical protein
MRHPWQCNLVTILLIWRAGLWPDLGYVLPSHVVGFAVQVFGIESIGQTKEEL